jgi:DNA-binding FadR family transcriptional regulator
MARQDQPKRAARLANQLLRDVIADGWEVGNSLGSEPDLVERYGVSRAVLREAVRIVEQQGVAQMRRGPGGGLFVTAPSMKTVAEAAAAYLLNTGVGLDEIIAVRAAVEAAVADLAARRAEPDQLERLHARVVEEQVGRPGGQHLQLHTMISEAAANPAGELFTDMLARLTGLFVPPATTVKEPAQAHAVAASAHRHIVDAVAHGNSDAARRLMGDHIRALGDWLTDHHQGRRRLDSILGDFDRGKLGQQLALRIFGEIVDRDWPIGQLIGSEPELIKRYGVSRAVFREAVRLLEFHGVVIMRRGPGGGLFISQPDVRGVVASADAYLEFRRITPAQLIEMRIPIQLLTVDIIARRADDQQIAHIRRVLESEYQQGFRISSELGVDVAIADSSGNRVAALLVRVLGRLSRQHTPAEFGDRVVGESIVEEAYQARSAILDAIAARDPERACRRTAKFLSALEPHLN